MNKQIEEMARIYEFACDETKECTRKCGICHAKLLFNAGYRKVEEMEWMFNDEMNRYCSNCGANALMSHFEYKQICTPYCPMCGAKMKGAE